MQKRKRTESIKAEGNTTTLNRRRMKWVLAVVSVVLLMCFTLDNNVFMNVSAESSYGTHIMTGTIDPLIWAVYDSDSDATADTLVISGTGAMPNKYWDSVKEPYWDYRGSITKIIIEDGVTTVGDFSFGTNVEGEGFSQLTTATLADSVTTIGAYAFGCADKLTDLVLGEESQLQVVSDNAFYICSSFADHDIFRVKHLQTISDGAFWATGFNNTTIVLPLSITSYNTTALNNQTGLTLIYPAGLDLTFTTDFAALGYVIENEKVSITKIYSNYSEATIHLPEAFLGYPIVAITADRGDRTIVDAKHYMVEHVCQICGYEQRCGDNIFYEYEDGVLTLFGTGAMTDYSYNDSVPWYSSMALITKVVIPKEITSIGSNAFNSASNLTDIELEVGSQLTVIKQNAFGGCTSLADRDIFEDANLQTIEMGAFNETAYSGAFVLPSTLTSIHPQSFSNVLTAALILPAELCNFTGVGAYMGYTITDNEATITVFQAPYYSEFPNGILLPEEIHGNKLVAVTATHDTVTLKDISHNIVNHTCLICGYSDRCGGSMYYSFEDGVLTLSGSGDMYNYEYGKTPWSSLKDQITEVYVGKDITSIGEYAFAECSNLERLVLEPGSALQKLYQGCFLRAGKLSDVVLPETVNYMEVAFQECTNATVYYPETAVVSIHAFVDAEGFITYKMMNGKKYITSPTENMILTPENLAYTGEDLTSIALESIGIQQYEDGITVNGTNFGVDIDETKWVKSVKETSVIGIGTYTAQYTGTFTSNSGSEDKVVSRSFSVGKGNGSGTVILEGWTYGETAKDPIPTSATNGTDNVTYKYKSKSEADSTYSDTKPSNAGEYSVKATFAATDNYSEAVAITDFTIEKRDQTLLTIEVIGEKLFGNLPFTLNTEGGEGKGEITYSVQEGKDVLSISGSTATINGAGTVTVIATKAEDSNYKSTSATLTITIGKAAAPNIIFPAASSITYGQKLSSSILTGGSTQYGSFAWEEGDMIPTVLSSGISSATVIFTPNTDTMKNYEAITDTREVIEFALSKTIPSIDMEASVSGSTGNRQSVLTIIVRPVGDGHYPSGTIRLVDSTKGSDVNIEGATAVNITGGQTTYTLTGLADQIYKVKAVYSGDTDYNTVTSTELSFDTRKQPQQALMIDSIGTKTYGDGSFALSATGGSGDGVLTYSSSDPTIVSISGNRVTIHKAGSVTITATKAEDSDYNRVTSSVLLTVGKKVLTIKADDKSIIIKGTAMPEFTYTVTGLAGSDTFTEPIISNTAADTNTVGDYDITISGGTLANADNYIVRYIAGKLTIVNAPNPPTVVPTPDSTPNNTPTTAQPNAGTSVKKVVNDKEDWKDIQEQIKQTKAGDTVTVDMNGSSLVPKEVLRNMRGTDVTLIFDMGDGITWSVNGQSITEDSIKDIDFGVTMDTDAVPADIINQVAQEQAFRSISLSHNGKFGFTAVLSINVEKKNTGLYSNLYYYNPSTKQLELQSIEEINESGYVEFKFSHASDYIAVISTEPIRKDTLDQITINAVKGKLYVGGTRNKSMTLKVEIPNMLKELAENSGSEFVITYQSSNPKVATVTDTGKIIAKGTGETAITTRITINGVQKDFQTTIIVKKAYIKLTKINKSLEKGKTFIFQAKGYGVKTEDIRFYTAKKDIVVINKTTGEAVAKSAGTDYVIAKAGNVEVKMKVSVQ